MHKVDTNVKSKTVFRADTDSRCKLSRPIGRVNAPKMHIF